MIISFDKSQIKMRKNILCQVFNLYLIKLWRREYFLVANIHLWRFSCVRHQPCFVLLNFRNTRLGKLFCRTKLSFFVLPVEWFIDKLNFCAVYWKYCGNKRKQRNTFDIIVPFFERLFTLLTPGQRWKLDFKKLFKKQ